jgi:hypothetical protein
MAKPVVNIAMAKFTNIGSMIWESTSEVYNPVAGGKTYSMLGHAGSFLTNGGLCSILLSGRCGFGHQEF